VEHDERIGVVRHLDPALARVEKSCIPSTGTANRLLDDERLVATPRQPDARPEDRQAVVQQPPDPLRPLGVVRPGSDRDLGRFVLELAVTGASLNSISSTGRSATK
jgi:hypothetical protein